MKNVLRFGAGLLALAAVGLVVRSTVEGQESSEAAKPKPAESKKIEPVEAMNCQVKLIDSVALSSPRPGVLAFVEPREGDPVFANDHVAGLIDDVVRASYEAAKKVAENTVEIRFAKANFALMEVTYLRKVEANRKTPGVFPELEVQEAKLAAEKAKLQIEQAEHQKVVDGCKRDEAYELLRTYQLEAPFDGVVTKVYKQRGEGVREGEPVMEIVSTKRVRVEGYIHVKDSFHIQEGDAVKVKLNIPDVDLDIENVVFDGKIKFIDPKIVATANEMRVWADVVNKDNILREGFEANMTIYPTKRAPATATSPKERRPRTAATNAAP